MSDSKLNLLTFTGKIRTLHLTWFAFFLSFFVWFNHAPLMASIQETFADRAGGEGAADHQCGADHSGAHRNWHAGGQIRAQTGLLAAAVCLEPDLFSFCVRRLYNMLLISRFALGFVGAGFVIGIRMIGEWFPPGRSVWRRASMAAGAISARPRLRFRCPPLR